MYDHHAFRVLTKLKFLRIPIVYGIDQTEAKIIPNETFQIILDSKKPELKRLAYGNKENSQSPRSDEGERRSRYQKDRKESF